MTRERKIEMLAEAFRQEGFEVLDGTATMWAGDIGDGEWVTINLVRIAHDIDIELDRIAEMKR